MEKYKVDSITGEIVENDPNKEQRQLALLNINKEIFKDDILEKFYQLQALKEMEKELHYQLLPYMRAYYEATGEKTISDDYKSITYVKGSLRTDFDKEAFQKDHPDLFKKYQKLTAIKESVKVKIK